MMNLLIQFGIPKKWAMGPEGIFFAILFCVCGLLIEFRGPEQLGSDPPPTNQTKKKPELDNLLTWRMHIICNCYYGKKYFN